MCDVLCFELSIIFHLTHLEKKNEISNLLNIKTRYLIVILNDL